MTTTMTTRYGIWEERPLAVEELSPQLAGRAGLYQDQSLLLWRPSPEIASDVPADLGIAFEVVRALEDGNRRFVPRDGHGVFIQYGWAAGLAILCQQQQIPSQLRFSYRFMKLIFDRARVGREHLGRGFNAARDLYVRPTGRGGGIGSSLLPDCVGQTIDGRGHSWSIRYLTERGRQAAFDAGVNNPTSDVAICHGLTLAAEMNPLVEQDPEKIRGLVLSALFDAGESPHRSTDEEVDDVVHRLSACLEEHEEETWQDFEAWFSGRSNNLVKSLARKSGYPTLDRKVVKAGLLKLGLRSYEYVTTCLSLFAQAVRQGLAQPLNEAERRQFDAMYLPQMAFGGFPLSLLIERNDLIRLVIQRLWDNSEDQQLVGALHRLLAIYGELAPARRAVDRRFKQLQQALESRTRTVAATGTKKQDHRQLLDIVTSLVQKRGGGCLECQNASQWQVSLDPLGELGARATVACETHGFEAEHEFTLEELASEASWPEADQAAD